MKWENLKKNKCPQCGKGLDPAARDNLIFCSSQTCGFKIYEQRFSEIVASIVNKDINSSYKKKNEYKKQKGSFLGKEKNISGGGILHIFNN